MASVTYGKGIMASVIMAKVLWQIKLSPLNHTIAEILCCVMFYCMYYVLCTIVDTNKRTTGIFGNFIE